MDGDESPQSLPSETRDHYHLNEKSDLQRRRPRRGNSSDKENNLQEQNVVQNPLHPQYIDPKQETELHCKTVLFWLAAYLMS